MCCEGYSALCHHVVMRQCIFTWVGHSQDNYSGYQNVQGCRRTLMALTYAYMTVVSTVVAGYSTSKPNLTNTKPERADKLESKFSPYIVIHNT